MTWPIPKLPAVVAGGLGVLATLLGILEPSLTTPWHEIVAAVLAVLTALGITAAHMAVRSAVRAAHAAGVTLGRGEGAQ
jgi:Na+/H+-translocating membrane pyrophosphatase